VDLLRQENEAYEYAARLVNGLFGGKNLRSTGAHPGTLKTFATLFGASNWLSTRIELFKSVLDPLEWHNSPGKQWAIATALQAPIAYAMILATVKGIQTATDDQAGWDEFWADMAYGLDPRNLRHFMDIQMPDGTWVSPFTWEKDIVKISLGILSLPQMVASKDFDFNRFQLNGYTQARLSIVARGVMDLYFNKNFSHKAIRGEGDPLQEDLWNHFRQIAANTTPSAVMAIFKAAPDEWPPRLREGFPWTTHSSFGDKWFESGQLSAIGAFLDMVGFGRARTTNVLDAQVWEWNRLGLWRNAQGDVDPSIRFRDYSDMSKHDELGAINSPWFRNQNPWVVEYIENNLDRKIGHAESEKREHTAQIESFFVTDGYLALPGVANDPYAQALLTERLTLGSYLSEYGNASQQVRVLQGIEARGYDEPEDEGRKLVASYNDLFEQSLVGSWMRDGEPVGGVFSPRLMDTNVQEWVNEHGKEKFLYVMNVRLAQHDNPQSVDAMRDRAMLYLVLNDAWDLTRFRHIDNKVEENYYVQLGDVILSDHNIWLATKAGPREKSGAGAALIRFRIMLREDNVPEHIEQYIAKDTPINMLKLETAMGNTDEGTPWFRFDRDNPGIMIFLNNRVDWHEIDANLSEIKEQWLEDWIRGTDVQKGPFIPQQLRDIYLNSK
jgi:hypothetical protein